MNEQIEHGIIAYVERLKKLIDEYFHEQGYLHPQPNVSYTLGRRYAKIILNDNGTQVHSFVDLATGDILKAASWTAPAKTPRGSVLDLDKGGFSAHGADYMR